MAQRSPPRRNCASRPPSDTPTLKESSCRAGAKATPMDAPTRFHEPRLGQHRRRRIEFHQRVGIAVHAKGPFWTVPEGRPLVNPEAGQRRSLAAASSEPTISPSRCNIRIAHRRRASRARAFLFRRYTHSPVKSCQLPRCHSLLPSLWLSMTAPVNFFHCLHSCIGDR